MSASWVTLKLATSLDGRIATASGESRWITGEEARQTVHRLRAEHDAVVVGVDTALTDDPDLTVRLEGFAGAQPTRVVLDSRQRLRSDCRLALTARDVPTVIVSTTPPQARLADVGVTVVQIVAGDDGRPAPADLLAALAARGLDRLLVEGGGQVAASFLKTGLVDALEWFRAPIVLGSEGRPAIGGLGLEVLSDAPRLRRVDVRVLGPDLWERYERI